jgi:hypothetical protein
MATKAELKRKIEALEKRIEVHAEELDKKHDIRNMEQKLFDAREKLRKELRIIKEPIMAEIRQIKEAIEKIDIDNKLKVPQHIIEFLNKKFSGTDSYRKWVVKWISPDQRYFYASLNGSMFFSGRGCTTYGPTRHEMFDTTRSPTGHLSHLSDPLSFEGRLPKEMLEDWKQKVMA